MDSLIAQLVAQFPWLLPLAVVIGGLMLKAWVPGWYYLSMERERDLYRDMAFGADEVGEQAVSLLPAVAHRRRKPRMPPRRRTP